MENPVITVSELKQFLGATPSEISSLQLLFGACDQFDRANAALALMRLRQSKQRGDVAAGARPRQGGAFGLLRRLRGVQRRVPLWSRRNG
jgi:hypothetical protein